MILMHCILLHTISEFRITLCVEDSRLLINAVILIKDQIENQEICSIVCLMEQNKVYLIVFGSVVVILDIFCICW